MLPGPPRRQRPHAEQTDNSGVDVSVLIPSYQRPEKLAACVAALARQTREAGRYEVLVGLDGRDRESTAGAEQAWVSAGGADGGLRVFECPREGYNAVRNRLLREARGATLVSMNDDVVAVPTFLAVHLREQRGAIERGRPAIVTGYSPFRVNEGDSLFDRLVRETSMVFFYDRMMGSHHEDAKKQSRDVYPVTVSPPHRLTVSQPPDHDWGFRHCWGLNFSCPLGAVREVGGFVAFPMLYGYDDIELAWRLRRRYGMPVLFRPEALAEHDHRYTARDVLERERKLGVTAWHFAGREGGGAEFCREVFGRDIRSAEEVAYSREFVSRERTAAERLEKSFLALADLPASAIGGSQAAALVNLLYEQHLLLKRWWWRRGLIAAAESA